jgi:hypothetical protein
MIIFASEFACNALDFVVKIHETENSVYKTCLSNQLLRENIARESSALHSTYKITIVKISLKEDKN